MPITSLDDLINSLSSGQGDDFPFFKFSTAPSIQGVWHSTWAEPGGPAAGSVDATGTAYVNGGTPGSGLAVGASCAAGGFGFPSGIAVSPKNRFGTALSVSATQQLNVMIADRLCSIGPVTVTSTGSKTLTTLPPLPRYAGGVGVEAWLEVTTAFTGSLASFFLNSYTGSNNGSGTNATSARLATAMLATIKVGDMIGPFPLLSPDVGVQAIASFDVNVAPTAGAVNVVLLRRLPTMVPIILAATSNARNLLSQIASLPQLFDGASLFAMYQPVGTTAPSIFGHFASAYK